MTFGLELTFLPRSSPLGFDTSKGADKINQVVARFNAELDQRVRPNGIEPSFYAKCEGLFWRRHIVEVCSDSSRIEAAHIVLPMVKQRLTAVFDIARELGLSGRLSHVKDGVRRLYSNGGGHIHHGIDVFETSNLPDFLPRLNRFQRNLFADYANRPYIRWLFAHPFDNDNSCVLFNLSQLPKRGTLKNDPTHQAYLTNGIAPRFAARRKGAMATFEHRYFDATQNAEETLINLRFLKAWIQHLAALTDSRKTVPVTLTRTYFTSLKERRFAWREISGFMQGLGLNAADYRDLFERNYLTRMRWGEMV